MKLIKKNTGQRQLSDGGKTQTSLFKCPHCGKIVERITAAGLRSHTCSKACARAYGKTYRGSAKGNMCLDCGVDKCKWLLKGKAIKNWKAIKVDYPSARKEDKKTYQIIVCPNFRPQ